jgi:UDP-N-acetylmuramoyl-L-alanyl-D-glutamate--2,6-diaminopimelate ligase
VLGFGLDAPGAAVRAEGLDAGPAGNTFRLGSPYGAAAVHSPLVGRFNASNALAAAATALAAGLDVEAVAAGLSAPVVVPGRMERIEAGQPFPVLVDYAHTPDGLEQVLRAARPLVEPHGRLVVVFGCGGDRDRAKRPAMGKAAAGLADMIVVTSDNPRSEEPLAIIDEVVAGVPSGVHPIVEPDRRLAVAVALSDRGPGDVVVVAGKGHESGQTAGGVTVPFDDRVVTREELARLGWDPGGPGVPPGETAEGAPAG